MLDDPRLPLIFGVLMVLALGVYLALLHPLPGELSRAHSRLRGVERLSGCRGCHADEGLAAGCISCHTEIEGQLGEVRGYHGFLASRGDSTCEECHLEHLGPAYELVDAASWRGLDPQRFRHVHVEFELAGAHEALLCEDCHRPELAGSFHLPGFPDVSRARTFLGLEQRCVACHEDIHGGGLSTECELCHGQESFQPAVHFDHDRYFVLEGPHREVACIGCHLLDAGTGPEGNAGLSYGTVRGKRCVDCHESPHRTRFEGGCERCHAPAELAWTAASRSFTPEEHALTAFSLAPPHAAVGCDDCHPRGEEYTRRFPDPASAGYARQQDSCEGCHDDIHEGQFARRHDKCLDCHESTRFMPAAFGLSRHAQVYPLEGAHAGVVCSACHEIGATGARRFSGTSRTCKSCHASPHGGQFSPELEDGDCTACHSSHADTFKLPGFDHEGWTGYALTGAHRDARCADCHPSRRIVHDETTLEVRIYRPTARECAACHKDAHRGQFRRDGKTRCESCHTSTTDWTSIHFDHETQARFALGRAHRNVPCRDCHFTVDLGDGQSLTQYRPLGRGCEDCHDIERE